MLHRVVAEVPAGLAVDMTAEIQAGGGTSGGSAGTGACLCANAMASGSLAMNGTCPARHSYATTPSE